VDERRCSKCSEIKPLDEFGNSKRGPGGKKSRCKTCEAAYRRARRRSDKPIPSETRGKGPGKICNAENDSWWAGFFKSLTEHGIVTRAAEANGVHQRLVWRLHKENEQFRELFDEARKIGLRRCIDEAIRRGSEGWDEPVFFNGEQVGTKRKFSDRLLEFIIRANFERYRQAMDASISLDGKMSVTDLLSSGGSD